MNRPFPPAEALAAAEPALFLAETVEELNELGHSHLDHEQWQQADELFQQSLSRDAKSKRALLGRAIVLRKYLYEYVRAAMTAGREEDIQTQVAELSVSNPAKAEKLANAALAEFPDTISFLEARARLFAAQRSYDEAASLFTTTSAIDQRGHKAD